MTATDTPRSVDFAKRRVCGAKCPPETRLPPTPRRTGVPIQHFELVAFVIMAILVGGCPKPVLMRACAGPDETLDCKKINCQGGADSCEGGAAYYYNPGELHFAWVKRGNPVSKEFEVIADCDGVACLWCKPSQSSTPEEMKAIRDKCLNEMTYGAERVDTPNVKLNGNVCTGDPGTTCSTDTTLCTGSELPGAFEAKYLPVTGDSGGECLTPKIRAGWTNKIQVTFGSAGVDTLPAGSTVAGRFVQNFIEAIDGSGRNFCGDYFPKYPDCPQVSGQKKCGANPQCVILVAHILGEAPGLRIYRSNLSTTTVAKVPFTVAAPSPLTIPPRYVFRLQLRGTDSHPIRVDVVKAVVLDGNDKPFCSASALSCADDPLRLLSALPRDLVEGKNPTRGDIHVEWVGRRGWSRGPRASRVLETAKLCFYYEADGLNQIWPEARECVSFVPEREPAVIDNGAFP